VSHIVRLSAPIRLLCKGPFELTRVLHPDKAEAMKDAEKKAYDVQLVHPDGIPVPTHINLIPLDLLPLWDALDKLPTDKAYASLSLEVGRYTFGEVYWSFEQDSGVIIMREFNEGKTAPWWVARKSYFVGTLDEILAQLRRLGFTAAAEHIAALTMPSDVRDA